MEMYKQTPYYKTSAQIDTPDCMYKLKRIYPSNEENNVTEDIPADVKALETKQEAILKRLDRLQLEVQRLTTEKNNPRPSPIQTSSAVSHQEGRLFPDNGVLRDLVINADPQSPPLSLLVLCERLQEQCHLLTSSFVHSSVTDIPACFRNVFPAKEVINRGEYQLAITLIWKKDPRGTSMMLNPQNQSAVYGEANVCRYLARLMSPPYDHGDAAVATVIDQWVDQAASYILGNNKERAGVLRAVNGRLGKTQWLAGGELSIADILLWSALQQARATQAVPANVRKWLDACSNNNMFSRAAALAENIGGS